MYNADPHNTDPDTPNSRAQASHRTAHLILIFANMFWIFLIMWTTWGIGAVMILGVTINHLITRYELALRRQATHADKDDEPDDDPRAPQT